MLSEMMGGDFDMSMLGGDMGFDLGGF